MLTLLAIGLTVVLGAFSFGLAPSEDEDVTLAKVTLEVDNGTVVAVHEGGDALRANELEVHVDGGQTRIALAGFTDRPEDDSLFQAGERWTHEVQVTDETAHLALVHEPSGRVLAQKKVGTGD